MSRHRLPSNPKLPGDGRCYVCAGLRPEVAVKELDPFCSTECAKVFHAKTARRLGLLPEPRTLIADDDRPLELTARELRWIAEAVVPRLGARKKTQAQADEQKEPAA
jgi:hypothetical protein